MRQVNTFLRLLDEIGIVALGKHIVMPGINLLQSTFGFAAIRSSSWQPCAVEISQQESPGLTQYAMLFSGQSLFCGEVAGEIISRQTSRSDTAMMRKKGKRDL
jgi:hypothetical protein